MHKIKTLFYLIPLSMIIVTYNNCGGGFDAKYSAELAQIAPNPNIDLTPPAIPDINASVAVLTSLTEASFQFSSSAADQILHYDCQLDNLTTENCPINQAKNYSDLTAGAHTFKVRAIDSAGNASNFAQYNWTIDNQSPIITLQDPPMSGTATSITFNFSIQDTTAGVKSAECALDSQTFSPCMSVSAHSFGGLTQGSHSFYLRATDNLNNQTIINHPWTVTSTPTPIPTPPVNSGDSLGPLAASMSAGQWTELISMNGWNQGGILSPLEFGCTTSDYITQYAEKAGWDPIMKRLFFVGQSHGNCYAGRFIIYESNTNSWSVGPYPPGICQSGTANNPCFAHGYSHSTVNPKTGEFYYRHSYTMKFYKFFNGVWTAIPAPNTQSSVCCGALEYFPDMDRLIFVEPDWGVWSYNPATSQWTQLANTNGANAQPGLQNLPMSSGSNFARYNPVKKVLMFGGGTKFYKMNQSGVITTVSNPQGIVMGSNLGVINADPVSGKFIALSDSNPSMYEYNVDTDAWTLLTNKPVPAVLRNMIGYSDGLISTPISNYGVTMYIKYSFGNSKVYLYKHAVN
jgi:hypothetical protein